MHLNDYQNKARKTAIYPEHGTGSINAIIYVALGLAEEAGELAGHAKRILRDDDGVLTDQRRSDMLGEIGDVLWYTSQLANELEAMLAVIGADNLMKLNRRAENNQIKGQGSNR